MKKLLRGIEIVFLVIVLFTLYVLVDNVYQESGRLIALAGSDFDKAKEAYDLAVIKTMVGSFEKIVGAFVVFAFGKFGAKVVDNRNRMAKGKDPANISVFG